MMQVVNFIEARNNLKSIFDTVYQDHENVIVNRKNGENVVIISERSWEDCLIVVKVDKKILRKINEIIKDIKRELFDGIR